MRARFQDCIAVSFKILLIFALSCEADHFAFTVTSNQIGNTVLFAVTAFSLFGIRQETNFTVPAAHIGTSLGFFCIGVFIAGQIANWFQCKSSRLWLLITNLVGTVMVFIAALLNYVDPTGHYNGDEINSASILCSIGLLAFSAGAQVAMSRQLGMSEIHTTQATAAYVDLFVDERFSAPVTQNRSRNRRIIFLVTLCVGSFIGAPAYHYFSTAFCILLAGIVKALVLGMFLFNRSKKQGH